MVESREPYIKGEPFETQGRYAKISRSEQDPNILIKCFARHEVTTVVEHYNFMKEFCEKYMPRHQLVVHSGPDGEPEASLLTEEVKEERERPDAKAEAARQLEDMLYDAGILYLDNLDGSLGQGWGRMPDVNTGNVRYGVSKSDLHPRYYFLDNFPLAALPVIQVKFLFEAYMERYKGKYEFPKLHKLIELLNQKLNKNHHVNT